MKFEIISSLPKTTTNSFDDPQRETETVNPKKLSSVGKHVFVVLLVLLFCTSASPFISEANASWFTTAISTLFSPFQGEDAKKPEQTVQIAPEPHVTEADSFQVALKSISTQLFENLEDNDPQSSLLADGIAFTVFADLKKLTRTSSFGRYLSEQLMGEFHKQGFPVVEVRKSSSIMVMEKKGEYGLSRDVKEIGSAAQARTMLTGTYTVAGDHIMVNAKILDNANATMLSSATVLFEKNTLTEALLSDSTSAYAKKDTYVYMKKLEL